MSKNPNNQDLPKRDTNKEKDENKQGYPSYPEGQDIYEKFEEESDINPADTSKEKVSNNTNALRQQALDKKHNLSGKDLDVPGSELDDAQEAIGNEDEENNYYSLGGDSHDDLEQDKGD